MVTKKQNRRLVMQDGGMRLNCVIWGLVKITPRPASRSNPLCKQAQRQIKTPA